jgi:hypothetical protein
MSDAVECGATKGCRLQCDDATKPLAPNPKLHRATDIHCKMAAGAPALLLAAAEAAVPVMIAPQQHPAAAAGCWQLPPLLCHGKPERESDDSAFDTSSGAAGACDGGGSLHGQDSARSLTWIKLLDSPGGASSGGASSPASGGSVQPRPRGWPRWLGGGCLTPHTLAEDSLAAPLCWAGGQQVTTACSDPSRATSGARPRRGSIAGPWSEWLAAQQRRWRTLQRASLADLSAQEVQRSQGSESGLFAGADGYLQAVIIGERALSGSSKMAADFRPRTSLGARSVASGQTRGWAVARRGGWGPHTLLAIAAATLPTLPNLTPANPDAQWFDAASIFDAHESHQQELLGDDDDDDDTEPLRADGGAAAKTPGLPTVVSGIALDQLAAEEPLSPPLVGLPRPLCLQAPGPHAPSPPLALADRDYVFVPVPERVRPSSAVRTGRPSGVGVRASCSLLSTICTHRQSTASITPPTTTVPPPPSSRLGLPATG